jgi:hypothetical protein
MTASYLIRAITYTGQIKTTKNWECVLKLGGGTLIAVRKGLHIEVRSVIPNPPSFPRADITYYYVTLLVSVVPK